MAPTIVPLIPSTTQKSLRGNEMEKENPYKRLNIAQENLPFTLTNSSHLPRLLLLLHADLLVPHPPLIELVFNNVLVLYPFRCLPGQRKPAKVTWRSLSRITKVHLPVLKAGRRTSSPKMASQNPILLLSSRGFPPSSSLGL